MELPDSALVEGNWWERGWQEPFLCFFQACAEGVRKLGSPSPWAPVLLKDLRSGLL